MENVKKIATRESYGNALAELGDKYENLYVFDADLAAATIQALLCLLREERLSRSETLLVIRILM